MEPTNIHYYKQAIAPIGWILVICSVAEFLFTLRLPATPAEAPDLAFQIGSYASGGYLRNNVRKLLDNRSIWLSIIGLSVFWGISQVVLAAFPAYAKEHLGETNTVVIQGLMAASGIGIIIGSLIAGQASRRSIETGLVPLGALGIVASLFFTPQLDSNLLLGLDFLLLGVAGGLFIVPLNALIQFHAPDRELGTILAGNNWVQNIVMLAFLGLTVAFAITGMNSTGLFHLLTFTALAGALYTVWQLPQSLVRYVIGRLFAGGYRIRVMGFENLPGQGGVLMLGNHISWLDWAMLQIACPRPIRFIMDRNLYQRWYLKWFLDFFGVIPIAPGHSREALAQIGDLLRKGEVVCLFPEGAISRNGQLGSFRNGFERAVKELSDNDGVILPFYLRGLWGSRFSRASRQLQDNRHDRLRREVIVAFGKPLPLHSSAIQVKHQVSELSVSAWEEHTHSLEPLALRWLRTARRRGSANAVAEARGGKPLSARRFMTAVLAFSRLIRKRSPEQNIGLLLPTSSAGLITNMAVLLLGKTLVNLNFTASPAALQSSLDKAEIKSIYTSRQFLKKLQRKGVDLSPLFTHVEVYYLEDLAGEIGSGLKWFLLICATLLPASWLYALFGRRVSLEDPAAILFSSGSEGAPKGVMLSQRNILANILQVSDVLDTRADDCIMATLPLFHAFGLTVTGLMPLVEGIPAVCHPDPTDVLNIAKGIYRHQGSILCATSTFLRLFTANRKVHPLMLESLRVVVAGAERLSPEVRDAFKLKFGKEIYEGYGSTETTPVASVNIPDRLDPNTWKVQIGHKPGTVGLPLPGGAFRIVDPDTLENLPTGEDGLILFGGAQVMLGYLKDREKTESVIVEMDGHRWYKTGDKGHLDEDGFLTIVDRYSRFAKIGGEMVSLGGIEAALNPLLPEGVEILAVSIPDGRKGEKLVLLHSGGMSNDELKKLIRSSSLNPLARPSLLVPVEAIPKLGSGKNDFSTAGKLALEAAS
ncbi:acyl-[ACP]--phospholipid O-acyltransferase [Thiolapillus brandeum]|uniref:Acyl-[acyl-carrier-protein]-phospholipid O-acyltransferase / long-chain-fatty-acid--[acyl-carrier-protein] ligase n=1 Tax=Thiolapillus brandeum TaxID=1076588 RepID=A0A7U6GIE1_9GAMM|nr:acyl-[ACP]--phospholipid O-acyltransferase [Thiolapillus brandeum]BAO44172.1 acyl-[acyl-carrier-protein]-phospholipid O-acyltransferase / long-chain-fatty-acid--[acyl-carrier-protein] ligase [Thiolapillus brandeum]